MDEEKFIDRVETMLYSICGCDIKDVVIVLEKCLERAKNNAVEYRNKNKNSQERMKSVEKWAEYCRDNPDTWKSKIKLK
jgi:predicted class III extradiol MEMO1 family dioxygenase